MVIFITKKYEVSHEKVISSLLLLAVLFITVLSTSVFAESNKKLGIKSADGRFVNFTINAGLKPDLEMLQDIANENTDTTEITILDIGVAKPAPENSQSNTTDKAAVEDKTEAPAGVTSINCKKV